MFWRRTRNWGMVVLAAWLIATGALSLLSIHVPWNGQLLSLLAVAAGILILMNR